MACFSGGDVVAQLCTSGHVTGPVSLELRAAWLALVTRPPRRSAGIGRLSFVSNVCRH